jgi:hypothetical protein
MRKVEMSACRVAGARRRFDHGLLRILTGAALIFALSAGIHNEANAQTKASKAETGKGNDIPEVPGDDIFGFTSATDVGDKGDLGFANELTGFRGKRDGSYTWLSNKMELGYTFAENWWIAGSAFISNNRISDVTDIDDRDATAFEGLSFEIKHRIIERSRSNPLAVTLSLEPYRSWIDVADGSGRRADGYGAAFKVYTDAAIVPDTIFWAANAVWVPFRQQLPDERNVWLEGSGTSLSTALTFQPVKDLFVGAEVRQLVSYGGTFFDERVGYAYYLGPTLLWKITDKIAFNATWQPQIAGRSIHNPGLRYDLDHFERAQFRFKLAVGLN